MAESTVAVRTRQVIADLLKVHLDAVTDEAHFVRNLGMESIQQVELLAALEEEFDVEVDEEETAQNVTVGLAIAYMEQIVG